MGIRLDRRSFLLAAGASSAMSLTGIASAIPELPTTPRPNPANFRSGDFIWPKKPGDHVWYASDGTDSYEVQRARWLNERDAYLARLHGLAQRTPEEERQLAELPNMEFREFLAVYQGGQQPGVPGAYRGGSLYVGHIGIVEIEGDTPYVVEALLHHGVIRHTYAHWLETRPGEIVWQGRLSGLTATQGKEVVDVAKGQVGKPYDFWNFDLDDDSGFYCSKLAWMSVYRATGRAIDGNPKAKRGLWFSPKQMLYADAMARLHDPGNYGNA